jgi:hypothetical protein
MLYLRNWRFSRQGTDDSKDQELFIEVYLLAYIMHEEYTYVVTIIHKECSDASAITHEERNYVICHCVWRIYLRAY